MVRKALLDAMQHQGAIYWYHAAIGYQRPVLQTLFYAATNLQLEGCDWEERLAPLSSSFNDNPIIWSATGINRRSEYDEKLRIENEHRAARSAAVSAAAALMLLTDKLIKSFARAAIDLPIFTYGRVLASGVSFARVARAFADQARHLHHWIGLADSDLQNQRSAKLLIDIGFDPRDEGAPLRWLESLGLKSFLGYEELLHGIWQDAEAEMKRRVDETV